MDVTIEYDIRIYDNDNDLHNEFLVKTEEEKDLVLKDYYYGDKEAKFCTIDRIETHSDVLFKENFRLK